MKKTRLDVLLEVLGKEGITKENIHTRNSLLSKVAVDPNSDEFIVKEGDDEIYYDVLKKDELDVRVEDLIRDCFSDQEIEETYGLNEDGEPDFSTADINTYLELVAEQDGYFIYTPQ